MSLAPGARLGPYEIVSPLGAGGMGEVYRARDTRLDRSVAIKVLPAALAADSLFRERFDREARALSALSHPHICTLHDVGEHEGTPFLVMEHLGGQTLAERLARGAMDVEEALAVTIQIADALDAAHRRGIVHRDLKPANVMLTKSGAKLLDFGLARTAAPAVVSGASIAPTFEQSLTARGTILGTIHYMAPEQLEGVEADARTDIFAFGVVLYEMLTGRKAFNGRTPASLIGAILKDHPPPVSLVQPLSPARLDRVVRRCLAKDPEDRWQSVRDLLAELQWIVESGDEATTRRPAARRAWIERLAWSALVMALIATTGWVLRRSPAATGPMRMTVAIPQALGLTFVGGGGDRLLAVSPDGRRVAFAATAAGRTQIYLRSVDQFDVVSLRGTEGGSDPFFSPDGQWLGFVADAKLKKVPIGGGPPIALCDAASRGADWGPDGTIVFATSLAGGLARVSESGGTPEPLTKPDESERSHRWPSLLPGGTAVLFTIQGVGGSFDDALIVVRVLSTGEQRVVVRGGTSATYLPTGHVVFARGGALLAVPFDLRRLEATGPPVPVLDGVSMIAGSGAAQYATSETGSLVFLPGALMNAQRELVWVDRKGIAIPVSDVKRPYQDVALSPDGRRIAAAVWAPGGSPDIWVYEPVHASFTRLTFGADAETSPDWTPDGRHIAFTGGNPGARGLFQKAFDGSGIEELLLKGATTLANFGGRSWHPNGQWLVYDQGGDIQVVPLTGDRTARPLIATRALEIFPAFSPDGRWVAYQSNESGRFEIYVQPFPAGGGKWQVSTEGGIRAKWSRDGRELFFRTANRMLGAPVTPGTTFSAGTPRVLFEGEYGAAYDVSADSRFLMIRGTEEGAPSELSFVQNWFDDVKAATQSQ